MKQVLAPLVNGMSGIFICAQPSVQPLIDTEKAFEQRSHTEGVKNAFLFFADANGLMFTDTGAVNARSFWKERPDYSSFISWSPSFAEISDGGDWGYTTGAAQFRRKSPDDSVVYASQYTTVWRKDAAGNWKYLMDIGVPHASIPPDTVCERVFVEKTPSESVKDGGVLQADKNFNDAVSKNVNAAYNRFAGTFYLLNETGHFIKVTADSAVEILKEQLVTCVPAGVMVAPEGDLAFVYGRFRRGGKEANYVRIWRHESDGWKVALEVFQ